MSALLVMFVLLIALGVASARGWSVDSRDPDYDLGALDGWLPL